MPINALCDDSGDSTTKAEKNSPVEPGEKVFYPHSTSRSGPDTRNPSGSTIPLGAQAHWSVQGPLRGFTSAINVFAQH